MKKELVNLRSLKNQTTKSKDGKEAKKKIKELEVKVQQSTVSKANAEAETTISGQTAEQTDRRTGRKGTMFLPESFFFNSTEVDNKYNQYIMNL